MLFTFVFLDGDFNAPKDSFADLADSGSQGSYRLGRIEVKDRHEVLRVKAGVRTQTAPGKQAVSGADRGCIEERHAFVIIMILLQMGTVNDAKNVLLVGKIVFRDFYAGNLMELFWETAIMGDFKLFFQSSGNYLLMFRAVFPEVGITGAFSFSGVCHIENVFELGSIAGIVNEGNALGTPANVATHSLVPQLVVCTGGSFWTLGIDHELFMVGVLVEPCSGGKKVCPALIAAGYFLSSVVCQMVV